jgi:hypothetical protein
MIFCSTDIEQERTQIIHQNDVARSARFNSFTFSFKLSSVPLEELTIERVSVEKTSVRLGGYIISLTVRLTLSVACVHSSGLRPHFFSFGGESQQFLSVSG